MIRYAYVAQLQPPAPFVHVQLQNPVTGRWRLQFLRQAVTLWAAISSNQRTPGYAGCSGR
jgi:hypothetical protein